MRLPLDPWKVSFFAALGLTIGACGPSTTPEMVQEMICANPEGVLQDDGSGSGFLECEDGTKIREMPAECAPPPPSAGACEAGTGYGEGECTVDDDCTERPNGRCQVQYYGGCTCQYPTCVTDADCDAGEICDCGVLGGFAKCVEAECASADDCDGFACVAYDKNPSCGTMVLGCHGPEDSCYSNSDCEDGLYCIKKFDVWQCVQDDCAIGRPFLVHGETRAAPITSGRGWESGECDVCVDDLDASQRRVLADAWTRAARMEHASVAAFARFALQLVALGAPPSLIAETRAATRDELDHARRCFALASAYAGRPLAPAALPIGGALDERDIADTVCAVLLEGCIGETVAAVEAAEAREHAHENAVRETLAVIAEDERRHALLAWRFLAWALPRGGARLRERVLDTLARAQRELRRPSPRPEDRWQLAHGVVPEDLRADLRRRVLHELVIPGIAALLEIPAQAQGSAELNTAPPLC